MVKTVGIVILNYNSWIETVKCVDSVVQCAYPNKRIVVVDNASSDDSYNCLSQHFMADSNKYRDVVCVLSDRNGGYAYGNNIGINYCEREGIEYAIISNGDVVFDKYSIDHLVDTIINKNSCVIVSPYINNKYGEQTAIPLIKKQSFLQFIGVVGKDRLIIAPKDRMIQQRVYMVSGCCYAVNIPLFKKMGALDEHTFLYEEEAIMAKQADRMGYEIWYSPNAQVVHNHKVSQSVFGDFTLLESCLYYWKEYEDGKHIQLWIIRTFFLLKYIVKLIIGKYKNNRGFYDHYLRLNRYYKHILKSDV